MLPISLTSPARIGCSACPGDENATPRSEQSQPSDAYDSGSVGRTLGLRSLNAFSSIRGSFKGRRAAHPNSNQEPAATKMRTRVGSNLGGPLAKQRWYESLRGKPSQIPTPSTPTSMSRTLKRSLRSSPTQPRSDGPSPSAAPGSQATRDPLPKLETGSFQSELQQIAIFGDLPQGSVVEAEPKPKSWISPPVEAVRTKAETLEAKFATQSKVAADPTAETRLSPPRPTAIAERRSAKKAMSTATTGSFLADSRTLEQWRVPCDLYYKGTPWQSERKKRFLDATAALSHFALRHMLSEHRDCSNTLLWTSEIQMTQFQVNQTFTVYPVIDGPLRRQIRKHDLHWAIITFTNGPSTTTGKRSHEEDERLMMAIHKIISMGYHVDVWTSLDDSEWNTDLVVAETELVRGLVEDGNMWTSSRSPSVFLDPRHLERREVYEVFVRNGIAGFLQADLNLLDKLRDEILQPERLGWDLMNDELALNGVDPATELEPAHLPQVHVQDGAVSELMGFLEHTEETIAEVDGD